MITMKDLKSAEPFTVFRGPAEDPCIGESDWELFSISGYSELPDVILEELGRRRIQLVDDMYSWVSPRISLSRALRRATSQGAEATARCPTQSHDAAAVITNPAVSIGPVIEGKGPKGEQRVDDFNAALAYLREGGTLCKVPDDLNSKYSRLYAVARVPGAKAGKCLPEEKCAYCGKLSEGFYSLHRGGYNSGPKVSLCNLCGGGEFPTVDDIWDHINAQRGNT